MDQEEKGFNIITDINWKGCFLFLPMFILLGVGSIIFLIGTTIQFKWEQLIHRLKGKPYPKHDYLFVSDEDLENAQDDDCDIELNIRHEYRLKELVKQKA